MWIKICGFKDLELAEIAANSRVDAIGLNFYQKSPRFVDVATAEKISKSLSNKVLPVGLFVNHTETEVFEIINQCQLPAAQFHGDENPEFLSKIQTRFPNLKIIKAYRMKSDDLSDLKQYLDQCEKLNVKLFACLIDAYSEKEYGGTGQTVQWQELKQNYLFREWPPLILAGGLSPENISDAVDQTNPWGIDTASGVETAPGVKDPELIRNFINQIR